MSLAVYQNEFRTCQTTGLKVHLPAQRLIWAHAVTAVVFLLLGGLLAIMIALTRVPSVHLLSQEFFYRFVSAHGMTMLVFWIVFFEMAGLIFGASIVLNARFPGIKLAWFSYGLMLTGALIAEVITFMGKADVMFTAYVPLKAHPLFYVGVILFAVGALITSIHFLVALYIVRKEGYHTGSLPLFTFGLVCAAVIAVFTLLCGAITFVPTLLWSMDLIPSVDPMFYRIAFWGFGHSAQQVNLCAHVSIWYLLASLTVGAKPVNQKLSRVAFLMYVVAINLGSIHHLLVDPALKATYRIFNTSYMFYIAVIASFIHAISIPAAVETAQRAKGFNKGLFGWLVKAPWGNPGFSGLVISFVLFGFIGGATGLIMSVEQLNMLQHNNLRVPGHFHGTVAAGTSLAFMTLAYFVIPLVFQRKLRFPSVAKFQPYVFGLGMILFTTGMHFSGVLGAPRRHWDITFQNAVFQVPFSPTMNTTLAIMGIGATIAFTGLFMFLLVAVSSVFFGEKVAPKFETHKPQFAGG